MVIDGSGVAELSAVQSGQVNVAIAMNPAG
jgi:hypothetical protein